MPSREVLAAPGLWLAVPALRSSNMMQVLNVLQLGIADEAHQAFIQELAGRSKDSSDRILSRIAW